MSKLFSKTPANVSVDRSRWGGVEAIFIGVFGTLAIHIVVVLVLSSLLSPSLLRSAAIRLLASLISSALCLAVVRAHGQSWTALGVSKPKDAWWKGILVAGIAYFVVSSAIFWLLGAIVPSLGLDQAQKLPFSPTHDLLPLIGIYFSVVLMPAVFEEIVYRGFIFGGLRSQVSFWPAAALTSVLFGLAHLQLNVGIDTFCLSLALCWLYERYRSLAPAILLHLLKNSIAFALLFL